MSMEFVNKINSLKVIKYLLTIFFGTIVLAISSKVKIPFYPVPMTMQTLVVLLIGIGFGWKIGLGTVSLYLLEGIIGLPVFAGTPEKGVGLIYFTGPTMGYLIGFLITVFLVGKFNYKNLISTLFKITFATSFIYIFGIMWLGMLMGWDKPVFKLGVLPFISAEVFKIIIASLVANKIAKFRKLF